MNSGIIVDIILICIIGFSCYLGYKRGFLISLYNLLSFFISIWLAWLVNPIVKSTLINYTNVDTWLNNKVKDSLVNIITKKVEQGTLAEKEAAIETINVPRIIKESLIKQTETMSEDNSFLDFIADNITNICLSIISFILVILVVLLISIIIKGILQIISELPIIEGLNKLLGVILGVFISSLQIWFAFLIINLFSNVESPGVIVQSVISSTIGNFYYQNNLISYIIVRVLG